MDQLQSNVTLPPAPVFIPDELIVEILSFLTVKAITRFKSVNKSWKTLFNNPTFIKMHLQRSSRNPHFKLTQTRLKNYPMCSDLVSLPLHRLLENPSITVAGDTCRSPKGEFCEVVGSINGLLCVLFINPCYRFRLWNPATRTISRELGFSFENNNNSELGLFDFIFCCDYLTGDYKVVACRVEHTEDKERGDRFRLVCTTRVLSLSDDCWRKIQSFPLLPFIRNNGVHFRGTVNWFVVPGGSLSKFLGKGNKAYAHDVELLSLDLSTETYTRFLLPKCFDDSTRIEPSLRVLMDCLCCSQDFERTELVIWQMKEFGIQDSWTQLFRIEYISLQIHNLDNDDLLVGYDESVYPTKLLPLYLSKNGDTLILKNEDDGVIIYNCRDKRVERTTISNDICWFSAINYVESLVSTPYMSEYIAEDEDQEKTEWYSILENDDYDFGVYGW